MSNKKKRKVFDNEYMLRFGLLCVIALGLILLSWTFKFKSNQIVELNDSNTKMFNDKFNELADASQYGQYKEMNISAMGQKKINLTTINRAEYTMSTDAFLNLPNIPNDWGRVKYTFDVGRYYILRSVTPEYYLQPEFYDDWHFMGKGYYENAVKPCKRGFFATPNVQRIYTKAGATVETYAVFRASFCSGSRQAFKPIDMYPISGTTEDGIKYVQDPNSVQKYIKVSFNPDGYILGKAYPSFDGDWAQKAQVKIDVADGTPRGLYVVSVCADYYKPMMVNGGSVDFEAYNTKSGTPLMNFIVAVD
jgi:hypothetical protein